MSVMLPSPVEMEAFNIKFVGIVEKYPVLYNFTLSEYSRKDLTDKAWHLVAAEVNLPGKYLQLIIMMYGFNSLKNAFISARLSH